MGGQDKQVAFEDPHSSASDEDAKAVEVTTSTPQCPSISCHHPAFAYHAVLIVNLTVIGSLVLLPPGC